MQEPLAEIRLGLTVRWQVHVAHHRQELVAFALAFVFSSELLRRDVHQLDGLADLHVLLAFHRQKIFLDYPTYMKFEYSISTALFIFYNPLLLTIAQNSNLCIE